MVPSVPRFLHVIALLLTFMVSGAPAWIGELAGDDCAEQCASESACPDEGCADCSIICSSCPRAHVVVPSQANRVVLASVGVSQVSDEASERLPASPPPEGVFHPPRRAG